MNSFNYTLLAVIAFPLYLQICAKIVVSTYYKAKGEHVKNLLATGLGFLKLLQNETVTGKEGNDNG